jgi:Flp pilus assembly protein TadG
VPSRVKLTFGSLSGFADLRREFASLRLAQLVNLQAVRPTFLAYDLHQIKEPKTARMMMNLTKPGRMSPDSAGVWLLRAFRGSRSGQSLIEFAVVAPIFFLLIFAVLDLGRVYFVQMTVQHSLREAGRFAVTGNHLPNPSDPTKTLTRIDSIREVIRRSSVGVVTDVQAVQISSQGVSNNAGEPGQPVTLSLSADVKLVTPFLSQFFANGSYRVTASTTFQNEPFPTTQAQ